MSSSLSPIEWVPGSFPIPFFQTWCCEGSVGTQANHGDDLKNAGLPPKMYECVVSNLIHNRVGVDCVHYLYNDADCRAFIQSAFPPDVVAAYDRLIPTAFKADLWRYCVLYKFGGVYLDIKYRWGGGGCVGDGVGVPTLREIVERWGGTAPQRRELRSMCCAGGSTPQRWWRGGSAPQRRDLRSRCCAGGSTPQRWWHVWRGFLCWLDDPPFICHWTWFVRGCLAGCSVGCPIHYGCP